MLPQCRPKFQVVGRIRGRELYLRTPQPFYGHGSYFSDSAAYCDESFAFVRTESATHRELILARVLCGRVKEFGQHKAPELMFPPEGFDSVRGGPHKFNAHSVASCNFTVVYDRAQVYPQYIVEYTN